MIRKRGRKGFCSAEFMIDGYTYQFTFNGKKGMPLITSKTEARESEFFTFLVYTASRVIRRRHNQERK